MHPDGRRRELSGIAAAHRFGLRRAQKYCAVHPHGSERVSASEDCIVTAARMNISASKSFIFFVEKILPQSGGTSFQPQELFMKIGHCPRTAASIQRTDSHKHRTGRQHIPHHRGLHHTGREVDSVKNTNIHELITNFLKDHESHESTH